MENYTFFEFLDLLEEVGFESHVKRLKSMVLRASEKQVTARSDKRRAISIIQKSQESSQAS